MTTPAVLITICDGTADYQAVGDVNVVVVDFDRHDLNRAFPDDLDSDIRDVRGLPKSVWRDNVLTRLRTMQQTIADNIRAADQEPPMLEDLYCDYCETDGHTFRSCPRRDDTYEEQEEADEVH